MLNKPRYSLSRSQRTSNLADPALIPSSTFLAPSALDILVAFGASFLAPSALDLLGAFGASLLAPSALAFCSVATQLTPLRLTVPSSHPMQCKTAATD
jgi:hypothetical protein